MNQTKLFFVCWGLLLLFFNLLAFLTPELLEGAKFSAKYWLGYSAVTVALLINLAASAFVFQKKSHTAQFYNLPLVVMSYGGLILLGLFGTFIMIYPILPGWLSLLIIAAIAIFTIIYAFIITSIGEEAAGQTEAIAQKTAFIKNLRAQIAALEDTVPDELKETWQKVDEALKFSDPVSSPTLAEIESRLNSKAEQFTIALHDKKNLEAKELATGFLALLKERNTKCKLAK